MTHRKIERIKDRSIAPPLREIRNYELPTPNKYVLDNGVSLYEINTGTQPILKLELIFFSGRWFEDKKLVSRTATSVLREGSKHMNGAEIAERIDFYGGSIHFTSNLDTSHISVFCLTKHLSNILPILSEVLAAPSYPADEVKAFLNRSKERLKVDLEKNDTVAYRQVTEMIYGKAHPYGYNSSIEMYDAIQREDCLKHFETNFVAGNCFIMLSGRPSIDTIQLINQHLGQVIPRGSATRKTFIQLPYPSPKWQFPKVGSFQTAIRIGKRLFNRHHPDYQAFYVLNTILGGYFGSRLMQNLREEHGYTYNVYAALDPMIWDGYFMVGTEVKTEIAEEALQEIYKEFERLREEETPQEELDMVKNYLLGSLLTAVDGPFNAAEVRKMILMNELPDNYYSSLIQTIKQITTNDIQTLAQRYLQPDSFYEVMVG